MELLRKVRQPLRPGLKPMAKVGVAGEIGFNSWGPKKPSEICKDMKNRSMSLMQLIRLTAELLPILGLLSTSQYPVISKAWKVSNRGIAGLGKGSSRVVWALLKYKVS